MAASLTADILSDPIVFQSWPHYGGEGTDHWGSVLSPFSCHRSRPLGAFARAAGSDERRLYSQPNNNSSFRTKLTRTIALDMYMNTDSNHIQCFITLIIELNMCSLSRFDCKPYW